jgi:pimeloyl-ACP methyl ester carboxylesterase
MAAIRGTRTPAEDRAHVVAELTGQGLSSGTANWLATNLVRKPEGYVWRFNLDAIYELMLDYFRVDLWPVLESQASDSDFRVVVAERSDRWAPENRARLEQLVAKAPGARLHVVPEAGHWLHVDNPGFLLELMGQNLY